MPSLKCNTEKQLCDYMTNESDVNRDLDLPANTFSASDVNLNIRITLQIKCV